MNHSILSENQSKRLDLSPIMLVCFSMFCVWQMGFIYFMGPSLVLDGRTPLPIDMDNVTLLIASGYVLSIIYMMALPHFVVWAARLTAATALLSVLGLFFPLPATALAALLYIQTFCCCFMIGFETFIISNLFSERSTVLHLTAAYSLALFMIAVVQNDLIPVSFPVFRLLTLVMLVMMLRFFFSLPSGNEVIPRYVKKGDPLRCPQWLFIGIFVYSFVADIMMLGGPAAAAEVQNGVFLAYIADAVGSLILFFLYRKANIYLLNWVSIFMGLSVVGFLGLFISSYLPSLAYPACVLIGFGFIPCQLMPMYGMALMKQYPSRYIAPGIMGMALTTVLVQSALVELFRGAPQMLHLAYLAITVISIIVYWHLSPYLTHALQRKISAPLQNEQDIEAKEPEMPEAETASQMAPEDEGGLLASLTSREREVLELIGGGYSNRDIANILVISEHTVNDYTKKIYRKLGVHSRHAAAQIFNKYQ